MFRYNLRSATALLTIISILGPNSVCAMEPDEIETNLSSSLTLSRAPLLEPEIEVQSPPSSLSSSIPLDSQERPEGLFNTLYGYTVAPVSKFLTDYAIAPVANAATIVGSTLKNGLSEGVAGTRAFINGVDLYPTIQYTGTLAVPAMRQAGQDTLDYWNQPSAEYPAPMKNIMLGFAQEMGPNLHHLLINANRILGPEFTAKIVQRMGITQKAGTMVGNNLMQLTNPLGWGTTLITLTQMGFNLADLKKDGLFGLAKMEIAKIAARKAGLPENYMNLQQEALKTSQIFDEEQAKWHRYEIEHPAVEDEKSWAITNFAVRGANYLSNVGSYSRSREWNEASEAKHKAKTNLSAATDAFYATNGEGRGLLIMGAYYTWTEGLENTLRKTLTSFANDLESKVTTFQRIPETAVPLVKDTLKAFILGDESSLRPVIKQGKELSSDAKEIANAVNTVTRNPMVVLRNLAPEVVANAANDLSNMVNAGIGHTLGSVASGITEKSIRELNLKQINMFQSRELDLHINDLIQSGQLPDTVKTALDYAGDFLGFEELAQRLLQSAGKQAAVRFSNILGNFVLEKVNAASSKQYTLEELLTQEIDYSLWARSRNAIASWL